MGNPTERQPQVPQGVPPGLSQGGAPSVSSKGAGQPPLQAVPVARAIPIGKVATPSKGGMPIPQAIHIGSSEGSAPPGQITYPQAQPIATPLPQGQPIPFQMPQAQPIPVAQALPGARVATKPTLAEKVPTKAAPGRAPGAGATQQPQDQLEESDQEILEVALRNAPSWLFSLVVHMALMILLALWLLPVPSRNILSILVPREIWAEKLGEQLEFDSPLGMENVLTKEEPVLTPDNLPEVEDPFAAPSKWDMVSPDGRIASNDEKVDHIGLALHGRQEGMKKALVGLYGGNRLTEKAVELGLAWLARQQRKDGSWSLKGPYRDGATQEDNPEAATGLALLAFLGDGHTHVKGRYSKNVQNGINWLLKQQDQSGNLYHEGGFNHHFYTQGICTIALCELYAMTKDEKFKEPAQRAVQYCLASQSPEGGWRYQPGVDSDVSVTGWVVMALQSARMAGMEIPPDHFRRVERFLDRSVASDGFRYCYQKGHAPSLAMTAEALLCRQYLGWAKDEPRLIEALEWITQKENLIDFSPGKRNVYYWYYATQVCHHMDRDSKYWKTWNAVMREAVPRAQVKKGPEAGSWDPDFQDPYEPHGGRLYVTCLCIYMLEVYYRHLPIYAPVYTLLGKPKYQLP
ncbi:MAG: squalene--hopene cyclase [Thermoguttaceae bacterium]|nr:squalene--hopene cyclase [Thermoguttaceae bacterium]MDW8037942.1 prenyltransferase/squalene oxidase repeat-containing protein [Thermoguttaceae bacterium]